MKRVTATLLAIIATATTAFATSLYITSEDRPVSYDELPAEAKSFIENNFANDEVSHIILDRDVISVDYNVSLTSGTKLEFNSRGEWKEVDTRNSIVPNNIVPQAIAEYIKKNYPNREITEIKRNHTYTEVTLKGGLELTFNKNYNVVDVDD
ncbi:MAG: PepSY-like domain-containing protein [Alistipes sp.]|nr:PepSY-like domain-containing protein [Alistipes sp.]MBO7263651.1 PepSY-like domain-containing protein [Alistipes sp.]